jgi:lysophospholipase L1-like esterase
MKQFTANLALLGIAATLSLASGEAVMRAVVTMPLERLSPEVRYAPHPVRRFTLVPDQRAFTYGARATIDASGFRANGAAARQQGTTIFALGDSFTFGLGVNDDETWPAQLESRLRNGSQAINVLNGGTISYGVFQQFDLLKAVHSSIRPSVVIHGLYWNDYMIARPPAPTDPSVVTEAGYFTWDQLPTRYTFGERLHAGLNRSALFYAFKQVVAHIRDERPASAYSAAYQRFIEHGIAEQDWKPVENFYRDLQALGTRAGFTTFVVIMPVNDLVRGRTAASHAYPIAARQRLDALGIPYLDAFELWDRGAFGEAAFLPQGADSHLNADGYRILAEALAQRLVAVPALAQRLQ